ncbi:hypothetical protein C2G38_419590 [Gigaspora rosea]|uniref:Uncharacterized protein n=1 Tax=Gigaspora rosea TaxID=44941 RepID=A0A397UBM3_9GLOM|nr:hypothetical protein C2G38_419590 [Gigaspora rosea]
MFMCKSRILIFLLIMLKLLAANLILAEITNPRNGGRLEKRQGKGGQGKGGQGGQGQGGQGGQGQGGQGGQGQGGQGGQGQGGPKRPTSTDTDNSNDTPTTTRNSNSDTPTDTSNDTPTRTGRRNTGTSASTESKNTIYASYPYEGLPTCKSASDPECTPSNGQPIIKTITLADKIIPPPSGADPSNIKNTTYITTYTEYIASHSETVTNTNGDPVPTVISSDPSTIVIIRRVTAAIAQETASSSLSTNDVTPGLWGVMISFIVVGFSLVFMIFV